MKKLMKYIFCAGLFIMPFVFWPNASVTYEIPRVWFVLRWIELMAAVSLVGVFRELGDIGEGKKDRVLIGLVCAFFAVAIASALFGVDLSKSIYGNYYRWDGLITLFHLVGLFFILMQYWEKSWEALTALSIAAGALGVSVLLLVFKVTTFGQPNFLAGYLAVAFPFLWYFRGFGVLRAVGGLIMIAAIFATQSIGAGLSIVIALVSFMLLKQKISKKNILLLFTFLAVIVAILSLFTLQKGGYVAESRERIIVKGLLAFTKRPILGWGIANYDRVFDSVDWPIKFDHDVYVDKAHSTLVETLVTLGVFGFLNYLGLLARVFQRLIREEFISNILFVAFLVYIVHAQTNIISIAEELIFWIILGIVASSFFRKQTKVKRH